MRTLLVLVLGALAVMALSWAFYTYVVCRPRVVVRCTACVTGQPGQCASDEDDDDIGAEVDAEANARSRAIQAVLFKACEAAWRQGRLGECQERLTAEVTGCTVDQRRLFGPLPLH